MVVDFSEKSDLYIINTCAVTAESGRKSAQIIRRALNRGGCVAVIGCYSQLDPTINEIQGVSYIGGNRDKAAVFRKADELLENSRTRYEESFDLSGPGYESLCIGTQRTDVFSTCRAYVKIEDGCNGRCSYCIIPKVRGPVRSRPVAEIISEVQRLAIKGYKEIILTGIETSAYDYAPLSELINIVDGIEGIERLRFGSLSPNTITDGFLTAAADSRKFMPHIHLSLQSASDRILKLMRRPYNKEQMIKKMEMINTRMPDMLISADFIVGFPTETESDFLQTIDFVNAYGLSHVHAFPFSPRPGTAAASMSGKIPARELKKRNEILIEHSRNVKKRILERYNGESVKVLIESIAKGEYRGHTEDFLETKFTSFTQKKIGDIAEVNISSTDGEYLIGRSE